MSFYSCFHSQAPITASCMLLYLNMSKLRVLLCLLIVAMDVVAGILSIQAEDAKNKQVQETRSFGSLVCEQSSSSSNSSSTSGSDSGSNAFELALVAAVLLALSHITSNLVGGFVCICSMEELERTSSSKMQLWFACLVFSWIVAAVGFPMLIIGMLQTSKSKRYSCRNSDQHLLSIAGILCFVHGVFCIAFYVLSEVVSFDKEDIGTSRPQDGHL